MAMRRNLAAALAVLALASGGPAWTAPKAAPAAILAPADPASLGFSADRLARLDAHMKALVAQGHLPGATTLLIRHGKVAAFETYGRTGLDGPAMRKDTLFRIYSQTKPVTGVAMMMLFEEGRWKLDDPISKYLPELAKLQVYKGQNPDGSPITEPSPRPATMRELMSHSGGFAYGLVTDNPVDKAYRDSGVLGSKTPQAFIDTIAKLPLADPPGTRWRYSASVDIQGVIVERLSGQSLADFMQSRIFGPLKMTDTGFYVPAAKAGRLASLYVYDPKAQKLAPADGFMVIDVSQPPTLASGGGGLVSTTGDYARFAQMILNGGELDGARILAPGTIKLMAANHLSDAIMTRTDGPFSNQRGVGFGLDFAVVLDAAKAGTLQGEGTISWGGAAGTWFWIDPKNDLIFLGMIHILAKEGDPAIRQIDRDTATLVYQALTHPEK
ncbi:MAG: beta-lactamase [Caulobacter sp.]|nr:beta-lactamase [Caulobacter sp.]